MKALIYWFLCMSARKFLLPHFLNVSRLKQALRFLAFFLVTLSSFGCSPDTCSICCFRCTISGWLGLHAWCSCSNEGSWDWSLPDGEYYRRRWDIWHCCWELARSTWAGACMCPRSPSFSSFMGRWKAGLPSRTPMVAVTIKRKPHPGISTCELAWFWTTHVVRWFFCWCMCTYCEEFEGRGVRCCFAQYHSRLCCSWCTSQKRSTEQLLT